MNISLDNQSNNPIMSDNEKERRKDFFKNQQEKLRNDGRKKPINSIMSDDEKERRKDFFKNQQEKLRKA